MSIKTINSTPAADGFTMPAEWAHQQAVWMIWPFRPDNWREAGRFAQATFAKVADAVAAAGGALAGADLSGVNLARRVNDGEQIVVGQAPLPIDPAGGIEGERAAFDAMGEESPALLDLLAALADQLAVGPLAVRELKPPPSTPRV